MAKVLSTQVIHQVEGTMDGWPTLLRRQDGELLAVFSGNRRFHACPYGRTLLVRSKDDGRTWSGAETVNDTRLDDRDAGIVETRAHALVMTWFTSVAFEYESSMKWVFDDPAVMRREMAKWRHVSEALDDETRVRLLGSWTRRSADGGATWSPPVRLPVSAPHGPIALRDGRLLMVGKEIYAEGGRTLPELLGLNGLGRILTVESTDDGRTWHTLARLDNTAAPTANEPHLAECPDGTLVAMFRNEAPAPGRQPSLAQSESHDGGLTWTPLRTTLITGFPPHLRCLDDGRLLLTLSRRFRPWGQFASFSLDNGRTWDEPFPVSPESPDQDHGYPTTVQLPDGTFLTAYYEATEAGGKPCVKLSRWREG